MITPRRLILMDCFGSEVLMAKWLWLIAGCAGVLVGSGDAVAHPHAWIDLRTRVIMNDEGHVAALELDWLFDDFYTALIAEEFVQEGRPPSEFLREVANTNLANLADYDYFTDVRLNGERLSVGEVTRSETGLRDKRLWLRFEVPLLEPVDPHSGRLTFAVYDPTYYIEIFYLEGESAAFSGPGADACVGRIIAPSPSLEAVALASALDRNENGGDGLGELFAQTVVVEC